MPWKDGYTISDEQGIADADIRWPGTHRCCFTVTIDLSPPCGPAGITPADLSTDAAFYGLHAGLDALRETLARHGLRATVAVPGALAAIHPALLRALAAEGHEVAAHGLLHEDPSLLAPDEERARLHRTTALLADATGQRPLGWYCLPRPGDKYATGAISPRTVPLLREGGYRYLGNSPADDVPHYWVDDPAIPTAILALPYYYHFDDQFFLLFPAKGTGLENMDALARNWHAELDAQHARGRAFTMVLHPYAVAWPHRLRRLDAFLRHAATLPGLWNATAAECADHWLRTFPPETVLRLEPSIWQHHPDSLS